jgi:transcriptional regulator GlxA family with amidase domain
MDMLFILHPGHTAFDFAGPAEVLRKAADEGAPFRLAVAGPEAECANSLGVVNRVAPLPDTLADETMVFLLGTEDEERDFAAPAGQQIVDWLKTRFDPARHHLACICTGALLAARAGLLDGRRCTTHHALTHLLADWAPRAQVLENRLFVEDGPVLTSAGISGGVDLALAIVERFAGGPIATRVARRMVLYLRRTGGDPQLSPWLAYRNHLHPAVHKAQDLIARDPAADWPVTELASRVHVSPRHLSRLFRTEAGIGIVDYQHGLRIELARQLIAHGMSVERAAEGAGFGSARDLRRIWKRHAGGSPSHPAAALA